MIKNHPHLAKLLHEDALLPLGLKVTEAAHRLGISRTALSWVLNSHASISPHLALQLELAGISSA